MPLDLTITILFDNYEANPKLETGWGFACLVKTHAFTLLFDTGASGPVLLRNMRALGHDPHEIDSFLLSHEHRDHTGGLDSLLQENPQVDVYTPASFSRAIKNRIVQSGAHLFEVKAPQEVGPGMSSTGEISGPVREQALVCDLDAASFLITGCAHPGIAKIARRASELSDRPLRLALGGFHLGSASKRRLAKILDVFSEIGIDYVAPSHCSGDRARQAFRDAYGHRYLELGVGRILKPGDFV